MEIELSRYPGLDAAIQRALTDTIFAARMLRGDFSHLARLSLEEHNILIKAYREFNRSNNGRRTIRSLAAKIKEVIRRRAGRA